MATLGIGAALLVSGEARAQGTPGACPEGTICGANFEALPIALVTATGSADDAADLLGKVLKADLQRTGIFKALDPKSFIETSVRAAPDGVTYDRWGVIGAAAVSVMQVGESEGRVRVQWSLHDVAKRSELAKITWIGNRRDLRQVAHRWADTVFRTYTGRKGVSSTRLAFARPQGRTVELWVADADGAGAIPLTTGRQDLLPAWSPDGQKLLLTSYRTGRPALHVADVGSMTVRSLSIPGPSDMDTGGVWSPDGKQVAFARRTGANSDIYIINSDGTGLKRLTDDRAVDTSPAWSPDGSRLAFVSSRRGGYHIFSMKNDGSDVQRVTVRGGYNTTPRWVPGTTQLVFTGRDEKYQFDIFRIDTASNELVRLTEGAGHNDEPSVSPDGRHVVFTSTRQGGRRRLWVMDIDGQNPELLEFAGDAQTPAWGPLVERP